MVRETHPKKPLFLGRQFFPEGSRGNNPYLPDVLEALQLVITGNQNLCPGADGRRHDFRVILVLDGEVRQPFRLGHDGILDDKFQVFRDQRFRDAELHGQDAPHLLKNPGTGDEFMGRQNGTEYVGAQPPGRNRADDDVSVQENPHETSRNTSSSVR